MNTIILRNNGRKGSSGTTYTIEALGDSPVKAALRESIGALEHHPAKAARRSIIDMLSLIEKHNLRICHTEHTKDENDLEEWLFVLQG